MNNVQKLLVTKQFIKRAEESSIDNNTKEDPYDRLKASMPLSLLFGYGYSGIKDLKNYYTNKELYNKIPELGEHKNQFSTVLSNKAFPSLMLGTLGGAGAGFLASHLGKMDYQDKLLLSAIGALLGQIGGFAYGARKGVNRYNNDVLKKILEQSKSETTNTE